MEVAQSLCKPSYWCKITLLSLEVFITQKVTMYNDVGVSQKIET